MIRWEQEGDDWIGVSGELPVAKVVKDPEAERESWIWQLSAIKRPSGWRKPVGHRTTSLHARRSAEEYWAKWLPPWRSNPTWLNLRVGAWPWKVPKSGGGRRMANNGCSLVSCGVIGPR